jgi:hypothetical protein
VVGISADIYTQFVTTTKYFTLSAVHYNTYEVFSVCCMFTGCRQVEAANAVTSSVSMCPSLLAGQLTPTLLTAISRLSPNEDEEERGGGSERVWFGRFPGSARSSF